MKRTLRPPRRAQRPLISRDTMPQSIMPHDGVEQALTMIGRPGRRLRAHILSLLHFAICARLCWPCHFSLELRLMAYAARSARAPPRSLELSCWLAHRASFPPIFTYTRKMRLISLLARLLMPCPASGIADFCRRYLMMMIAAASWPMARRYRRHERRHRAAAFSHATHARNASIHWPRPAAAASPAMTYTPVRRQHSIAPAHFIISHATMPMPPRSPPAAVTCLAAALTAAISWSERASRASHDTYLLHISSGF